MDAFVYFPNFIQFAIVNQYKIQTLISRRNLIQFRIGTKWLLFNVSMKTHWIITDLNRMGVFSEIHSKLLM